MTKNNRNGAMKRIISLLFALAVLWGDLRTAAVAAESIPDGYTPVCTLEDLSGIRLDLQGKYILMNDIFIADEDYAEDGALYNGGKGWQPIGTSSSPFTGVFNGNGYGVYNLNINAPAGNDLGLFGAVKNAVVTDVAVSGSLMGHSNCGLIVGSGSLQMKKCFATGSLTSTGTNAGGLAGLITDCPGGMDGCYFDGTVTGGFNVGGIVGKLEFPSGRTVSNCLVRGAVSGVENIGGIIGNVSGDVDNSNYVSSLTSLENRSEVTGEVNAGGIVGEVVTSYYLYYTTQSTLIYTSSGTYTQTDLVPHSYYSYSSISCCVNSGNVSAPSGWAGGIVGRFSSDITVPSGSSATRRSSTVSQSYQIGQISSQGWNGAIVGDGTSYSVDGSVYYDEACVTDPTNEKGTAKSKDQLKDQSSFENWDFEKKWYFDAAGGYPYPMLSGVLALLKNLPPQICDHAKSEMKGAAEPTCTEDGSSGDLVCSYCGTVLEPGKKIPAPGHDYIDHAAQSPTCLSDGWQAYQTCSRCDFSTFVSIPATGKHRETTVTVSAAANCREDGEKMILVKCLDCSRILNRKKETLPATDRHTGGKPVETVLIAATCAAPGEKRITERCAVCGITLKDKKEEIPATGKHTEGPLLRTILANATCTKPGKAKVTAQCVVCGKQLKEDTEEIPATGIHINGTPVETILARAGCAAAGKKKVTVPCAVCGKTISETTEEIPSTGVHTEGDPVKTVLTNPSCGKTGETKSTVKCVDCGRVTREQTETVPATGKHKTGKPEEEILTEAICGDTGEKKVITKCADCGTVISEMVESIPATGKHSFGRWAVTAQPSGRDPGKETRRCVVCGYQETREAQQGAGQFRPGDVDGDGEVTSADARLALRRSVSLESFAKGSAPYAAGDADGDGEVTSADARLILRASVGLEKLDSAHTKHSWDGGETVKKATCRRKGLVVYTCTVCGERKAEDVPLAAHNEVVLPAEKATCKASGKTEGIYCAVCYKVIKPQNQIDALPHRWNDGLTVKQATCVDYDLIVYSCLVCNEVRTEITRLGDHNAVTDPAVAASCTESGKTEGSHCSVCGTILTAQKEIPPLGHKWGNKTVVRKATCLTNGIAATVCTVCGDTNTQETGLEKHTEKKDPAVTALCLESGKTEGSHCVVCGEVVVAQQEIPPAGHKWIKGTEAGKDGVYTCAVCGKEKIPEAGELFREWIQTNGKQKDGVYSYRYCTWEEGIGDIALTAEYDPSDAKPPFALKLDMSVGAAGLAAEESQTLFFDEALRFCGCEFHTDVKGIKNYQFDAKAEIQPEGIGKDGGAAVTVTESSGTDIYAGAGQKTEDVIASAAAKQLSELHKTLYESGSMLDIVDFGFVNAHAWGSKTVLRSATCTETGSVSCVCSVCGEEKTLETKALGHQWDSETVIKKASCTGEGTIRFTCNVCGKEIKQAVPPLGHRWDDGKRTKASTCVEKGTTLFTCTVCGATESREEELADHRWDAGTVTKEATCKEKGVRTYVCAVCGEKKTQETALADHRWDEGKVTKEAGCTTEGVLTYTCTVCGEKKSKEIPQKGHVWDGGKQSGDNVIYTCTVCGAKKTETPDVFTPLPDALAAYNKMAKYLFEHGDKMSGDTYIYIYSARLTMFYLGRTGEIAINYSDDMSASCFIRLSPTGGQAAVIGQTKPSEASQNIYADYTGVLTTASYNKKTGYKNTNVSYSGTGLGCYYALAATESSVMGAISSLYYAARDMGITMKELGFLSY